MSLSIDEGSFSGAGVVVTLVLGCLGTIVACALNEEATGAGVLEGCP